MSAPTWPWFAGGHPPGLFGWSDGRHHQLHLLLLLGTGAVVRLHPHRGRLVHRWGHLLGRLPMPMPCMLACVPWHCRLGRVDIVARYTNLRAHCLSNCRTLQCVHAPFHDRCAICTHGTSFACIGRVMRSSTLHFAASVLHRRRCGQRAVCSIPRRICNRPGSTQPAVFHSGKPGNTVRKSMLRCACPPAQRSATASPTHEHA